MLDKLIKSTPPYGIIPRKSIRFDDKDLFDSNLLNFSILKRLKIWFGRSRAKEREEDSSLENVIKNEEKCVLGVQGTYKNLLTGKEIVGGKYRANFGRVVEMREIDLEEGDFFDKFYINQKVSIYHITFQSNRGYYISVGKDNGINSKTILINQSKYPCVIQCLHGNYNSEGINALGFHYINYNSYLFIKFMPVLRLRHLFKTSNKEKDKWKNTKHNRKLPYKMRVLCLSCLLPDNQFSNILNFFR